MAKVANNILELIGDTPVVKLNKVVDKDSSEIYMKYYGERYLSTPLFGED